ncbi:aromatic ring-hydroxylating oxygenase subunit alpha [Zhongshania aquimaris]|uniref:Rieske 2Fe-2S domain-containing protein n=1 Tax=Zhongshania aquimaris TaxID=2857107 RepID=A0ABS6VWW7_9GAMM|nr:SRPBCC family protein [Zhongshania aquimaris]MBW2942175.1 Rieske 2Fe-2S domain-containing protein [Zhongshania aquimaris]
MDRKLEVELTEKALRWVDNHLGDYASDVFENPIKNYTDVEIHNRETDEIFRKLPQVAAYSCELPNANDFKTIEMAGISILLTRDNDGQAHAYINVCRHRGAKLVADYTGSSKRMICPYHGWAYDAHGKLCGVNGADVAFEGMCRVEKALTPVPIVERHGIIWVIPSAGESSIDIDTVVSPELGAELDSWNLSDCVVVSRRPVPANANWKLAVETFMENYHLKKLHEDTLAPYMTWYGTCQQAFGDNQRIVYPGHSLEACKGVPQEEWKAFSTWGISVLYHLFPSTIMLFLGDHYQMFQIFPGREPGTSFTMQTIFAPNARHAEECKEALQAQSERISMVLDTEDYYQIQLTESGLRSKGNESFVFGRNELPAHFFHKKLSEKLFK